MATQRELLQTNSSAELDMISNLPKELKEKILNYLPIKEAGRTSILSSTWRHTWKSIPDLIIHCDINLDVAKTVELVRKVLALHEGPIHKIDLQARFTARIASDLIRQLSKHGIEELSLHVLRLHHWKSEYKFPSSLFSCHYLCFLSLKDFNIKLPTRLGSMKLLRTLELLSIGIDENDLEKLISCCPVLENLTIRDYYSVSTVGPRICARNLRKFYISGSFCFIELCAPKLITLCLAMRIRDEKLEIPKLDLNKLFRGLPNLEILELKPFFLHNSLLDKEIVGGRFILQNLKEMSLNIQGSGKELPKFLPALFDNAPNLQVLRFEFCFGLLELMKKQVFSLENLEILNIIVSGCVENVLPFIQSMLASASKLRKLIIIIRKHYCELWRLTCLEEKVLSLTAPTKVQIIFRDN